jgi:hypothetical protein
MILNNNEMNNETKDIQTLDDFLIKKNKIKQGKTWSQLNKMEKIDKINNYVNSISSEYELTSKDIIDLKQYLKTCLNRKMLQRMKDVHYDKVEGEIKKINGLQIKKGKISDKEKKFTLKHSDKKDSTLKNLGSGKMKKHKLLKKHGITTSKKTTKDKDSSEMN